MNVLLVHPVHGAKYALCEAEILHDEEHGWSRYTEPTPEEAAPVDKPRRRARKVVETIEQPNSDLLASDESEGT